jgi:hypothetical protein
MSNSYNSILVTLQELVQGSKDKTLEADIKFNIPIYQRLYVWKEEQVKKLLEDTYNAFKKYENNDYNNDYYLGGVIVVKNGDRYDLIDGQQRFTTLWLIAQQLQENLTPFLKDRMHFSIREHANKFFSNLDITSEEVGELKNIKDALSTIKIFFEDKKEDKKEDKNSEKIRFSNYLYKKLKLVFTVVPQDVDLNKLFETINSGGVQLQHHELLKAKMLKTITNKKERKMYSKLWDSCSFMDNYIENNLAVALNCTKKDIYQNLYILDSKNVDNLKDIDRLLYFISQKIKDETKDKKELKEILEQSEIKEIEKSKVEKENEIKVRSIISFSMLLLHTLRIFLKKQGKYDIKEVNEKELLKIFTHKNNEDSSTYGEFKFSYENVVKFINLLWKVRFAFDENIIKWVNVEDNNDEVHMICNIYPNENNKLLQRNKELEDVKSFSLLQSMLYHTQPVINHYWLTPLLYKLVNDTQSDNETYLQQMDNYLFFPKQNTGDLKTNTWELLNTQLDIYKYNCDELITKIQINENLGTGFPHYLFYKIEYILWFLDKNRSNEFYFRAKNSVEHISPQTRNENYKKDNLVSDNYLHSFGNLALVSRERNSEFGNKPFEVKQIDFKTKKDDISNNLKMSLIYANENWGDEKCQEHLKDIKMKICQYLNCGESNEFK